MRGMHLSEFQFQIGAIKGLAVLEARLEETKFQFQIGAIKG